MYQYLDLALEKTKKNIRREFNYLDVMAFDSLNVVGTKKVTSEMFDRLLSNNQSMYLKVAKDAYSKAKKFAVGMGYAEKEESNIDGEWVVAVLAAYNLVTGYLYSKEAERKRLRLNEQILTAREYDSRQMYNDSLRKTSNLWYTQTIQYGIDIVDSATLQAYEDMGVEKVRWVAVEDGRQCDTCDSRNGVVYKLSEVPTKTHYGCRCYLEPVKNEE